MTPITDKLAEAAQAVIDRWDSPLWKDLPHTGEFINRLREALAAYASQQAEPSDARVEAAAKALLARRELKLEDLTDKAREHYLEDARAVLQAADAVSAGVPDGFVLVPKFPTSKMIDAGRWSEYIEESDRLREVDDDEVAGVCASMLAAAPGSEKEAGNG